MVYIFGEILKHGQKGILNYLTVDEEFDDKNCETWKLKDYSSILWPFFSEVTQCRNHFIDSEEIFTRF